MKTRIPGWQSRKQETLPEVTDGYLESVRGFAPSASILHSRQRLKMHKAMAAELLDRRRKDEELTVSRACSRLLLEWLRRARQAAQDDSGIIDTLNFSAQARTPVGLVTYTVEVTVHDIDNLIASAKENS